MEDPMRHEDPVHRMNQHLLLKGRSKHTISNYMRVVRKFEAERHLRSPEDWCNVSEEDVINYLLALKKKGRAASTINQARGALKVLFCTILDRPWNVKMIQCHKLPKRLPFVLSRNQVSAVIDAIPSRKHKVIAMTMYSGGLRLNETISLKPKDINSEAMTIHVRDGKGAKDRHVMLSAKLLRELRDYWKIERPKTWLFPSRKPGQHVDPATVQRAVKLAGEVAGVRQGVSPHTFRHSFATHLLENGTPLPYIQKLLGHASVNTTMIYLKIATQRVTAVPSPLDLIDL
jgi:site-specific recombinase XerD